MAISATMPETTLAGTDCDAEVRAAGARIDEESFRAFYERTAAQLWAYLVRIAGAEVADDLLQEAYYRFYRAGTMHESESHRRNSLFRIATNLAHDCGRMRRRRVTVPLDEELETAQGGDTAERVVGGTDLKRALDRLRPLDREILWLAYAQGSSHDEIAGIMGVSRKSIKSLLFRARRKLAQMLRPGGRHA